MQKHCRAPRLRLSATAAASFALASAAFAASISWNGDAGGNWSDPASWDGGDPAGSQAICSVEYGATYIDLTIAVPSGTALLLR